MLTLEKNYLFKYLPILIYITYFYYANGLELKSNLTYVNV